MKKSCIRFEDLPDTINPYDYADWRGVGENTAREIFNSKDFPRLPGTGVKQIADKRAVLLYELGLSEEDKKILLSEIAKKMVSNLISNKKYDQNKKYVSDILEC